MNCNGQDPVEASLVARVLQDLEISAGQVGLKTPRLASDLEGYDEELGNSHQEVEAYFETRYIELCRR